MELGPSSKAKSSQSRLVLLAFSSPGSLAISETLEFSEWKASIHTIGITRWA